jgi:parallel beta-helix repeat protein
MKKILLAFAALVFVSHNSFSATFTVNSAAAFATAQTSAVSGDVIIWANGTYSGISATLSKNGITLKAETPGGVVFSGNSGALISGSNISFVDFQYVNCSNAGSSPCINITGSHNVVTGINMNTCSSYNYLKVTAGAQYNEISNCNFQNKPANAPNNSVIAIDESATTPNYTKMRYCSIQHCPGPGGDYGNEPIRIGLRGGCISRSVIEYCYFTDLGGADNETISNKALENVIRYCTFDKNPTGEISLRHGGRNQIYGNFFINNSKGIVVKEGDGNIIYNNYFSTSSSHEPIVMAVGNPLYSVTPNNTSIIHNTFYNCRTSDVTNTVCKNTKFFNNIFFNSPVNGTNGNVTYFGNVISGNFGITVPAGNKSADPKLLINGDGYYSIGAGSPAIDAASSGYSIPNIDSLDEDFSIARDISGKARPDSILLKDAGCSEYGATGTAINKPLTLNDVGPLYLRTGVQAVTSSVFQDKKYCFSLNQAPMAQTVNITYRLPLASDVQLKIFNSQGQVERTLIHRKQQGAGNYSYSFNLVGLANRMCFAQFTSGSHSETIKVILAR